MWNSTKFLTDKPDTFDQLCKTVCQLELMRFEVEACPDARWRDTLRWVCTHLSRWQWVWREFSGIITCVSEASSACNALYREPYQNHIYDPQPNCWSTDGCEANEVCDRLLC